ncbi:MAG: hypothetical protein EXS18_01535 [Verrucomicrobiae bacterium]|nr:hypothetical protein [Verrucomicrobiae bacterium]
MRIPLSEIKNKPLDEPAAWSCLVANLVVLPGLGTVIAGKRVGYIQATLAVIGMALTLSWSVWFFVTWSRTKTAPMNLEWHLIVGAIGAVIFLVAWLWAFVGGWNALRQVRAAKRM